MYARVETVNWGTVDVSAARRDGSEGSFEVAEVMRFKVTA